MQLLPADGTSVPCGALGFLQQGHGGSARSAFHPRGAGDILSFWLSDAVQGNPKALSLQKPFQVTFGFFPTTVQGHQRKLGNFLVGALGFSTSQPPAVCQARGASLSFLLEAGSRQSLLHPGLLVPRSLLLTCFISSLFQSLLKENLSAQRDLSAFAAPPCLTL